jgi:hypothetical protein
MQIRESYPAPDYPPPELPFLPGIRYSQQHQLQLQQQHREHDPMVDLSNS